MIRTQIYLSEEQRTCLAELAAYKKENMSQLIREALEYYIAHEKNTQSARKQERKRVFRKAWGMWKDNDIDFKAIRQSGDRYS